MGRAYAFWNGAPRGAGEIIVNNTFRLSLAASLVVFLVVGCRVESHKDGKNENVSIGTPFGSMDVKTNDNVSNASIGITQYPGSVPYNDSHSDEDKDSADVNMSFGGFHLAVKAASFKTGDPQDKVLAFYRNDLKRYGDVIECEGDSPVGKPDRTSQGLACNGDNGTHPGNVDIGKGLELRAGSPGRQHIVAVETKDGGTKIGLVSLELPLQLRKHGDKDPE